MIIGPKLDRVNRPLNEGFGNHGGHSAAGVPASFDLRHDGKTRVFSRNYIINSETEVTDKVSTCGEL